MKRFTVRCFPLLLLPMLAVSAWADQIIGCPNGLGKGLWWLKVTYNHLDADKKWLAVEEDMVDLSQGKGLKERLKQTGSLRLGYGITDHLDVGITAFYAHGEMSTLNQQNQLKDYDASAMQGVWLSGKYMFVDTFKDNGSYFKLSLGAAYGFALVDDLDDLQAGLGPGADHVKIGLLAHGGFGAWCDYAGHLLYHWQGKAPDIQGFSRAGQDIADRVDYMVKLERDLGAYIGLGVAASGFFGVEADESLLNAGGDPLKPFKHQVMLHMEVFPMTNDYEKRKLGLQLLVPYDVRLLNSPDYQVQAIFMWTF